MSPGTDRSSTPARVTVVVVTHRGSTGLVGRCLESLRSAGGVDHLIVVDNSGSGDAALLADAWLRVDNEGFGSAVNRGIAVARQRWGEHQYIAVLNDDTRVGRDWLGPLVGALDSDPGLGAVQPKLLLADTVPIRVNSVGVELDRAALVSTSASARSMGLVGISRETSRFSRLALCCSGSTSSPTPVGSTSAISCTTKMSILRYEARNSAGATAVSRRAPSSTGLGRVRQTSVRNCACCRNATGCGFPFDLAQSA